jgi:hypothetical protein
MSYRISLINELNREVGALCGPVVGGLRAAQTDFIVIAKINVRLRIGVLVGIGVKIRRVVGCW